MVIEKFNDISLNFNLPITQFNEKELAKLYVGFAPRSCPCRSVVGFYFDCYENGALKPATTLCRQE